MSNQDRVMIFIDGSNVFRSMHRFAQDFKVDYPKLVDKLRNGRKLLRTYFYGSTKVRLAQKEFHDTLEIQHNFKINIKPLKGSGKNRKEKGVDVALVTEFLSLGYLNAYDVAVIVSGDQDYEDAIDKVQALGKRVEVASFRNSLGKKLRRVADETIILDDIASDIKL